MSSQFRVLGNRISRTGTGNRMGKIFLFVTVLLLTWFPAKSFSAVVYVDRDRPGGNGSSWETAYNNIEGAIAGSGESQEFWVAEGTYTPSNPLTPRPGSQFYGGFDGNETARNQRDVSAHPTVIDGQNFLKHVVFINMLATNVRIDGFTIKRGNADAGEDWDTYGGGIFVDQQSCVIANCTLTGNTAAIQGGAIFVNRALTTVENCEFSNNNSATGGGLAGHESALTISGCLFDSNSADLGTEPRGGAIYLYLQSPKITNCTFSNNTAECFGGAILFNNTPGARVLECNFSNNSARLYGGAIKVEGELCVIENSMFTGNNTETMGGAVFINRASGTIQNCEFQSNSSTHGGAVGGYESVLMISDCAFSTNSASEYGGAVYNDEESTNFSMCMFTKNTAGIQGGALSVNRAPAEILNCTFENNNSGQGGGLSGYDTDATISNCVFDSNKADLGEEPRGGAIWLNLQTPEIRKCVFQNNSSLKFGGAVEINNTPNALITECYFLNNNVEAEGGGGGLAGLWDLMSPEPSVTVSKCLFEANSSGLEGGAIYSYYCHFLIQETAFISNTGANGGAIMLDYELTQPSRIERSLFIKNSATARGGAIHCFERKIEIENSVFAFNSSPNAGAVSSNAGDILDGIVTMSNCTLYGNKAQKAGSPETEGYGGAMLNSYVSMVYLNNCIFWGNQADAEIWDLEQSKHVTTPDVFNADSSSMTTRYTDMESLDWEHGSVTESHTGSFSSDPMFEDSDGADNIEGTLDDNFHLTLESPCLDHADGDHAPELDIDFDARRDLVEVPNLGTGTPPYGDLGPYETQPVSFVNKDDSRCGGKVPCYTSIQGAIETATDGTTIKIVQGDYAEAIILSTSKDLSLKAGWDSAFTTQSSNSGIQSLTISDGTMKTEYLVIR